jgi:anti-sigma factor RsiW
MTTVQPSFARCTCAEAGERLSEYLDRELSAVDEVRVRLHLAACPRCAEVAAALAQTIRAVHRMAGRVGGPPACRRRR